MARSLTPTLSRVAAALHSRTVQSIDWVGLRDGGSLGTSRTGKVYTVIPSDDRIWVLSRSLVVGSFVIGSYPSESAAHSAAREYERDTL